MSDEKRLSVEATFVGTLDAKPMVHALTTGQWVWPVREVTISKLCEMFPPQNPSWKKHEGASISLDRTKEN